ncbi:MAG TPA: hypothetical protein VKY57_08530 [Chitinispirillaceae bacterium]|nr:hypothetical protein [Chitinispirillaceae bacterium]
MVVGLSHPLSSACPIAQYFPPRAGNLVISGLEGHEGTVILCSLNGKALARRTVKGRMQARIPLDDMAAGVLVVELKSNNRSVFSTFVNQ